MSDDHNIQRHVQHIQEIDLSSELSSDSDTGHGVSDLAGYGNAYSRVSDVIVRRVEYRNG